MCSSLGVQAEYWQRGLYHCTIVRVSKEIVEKYENDAGARSCRIKQIVNCTVPVFFSGAVFEGLKHFCTSRWDDALRVRLVPLQVVGR